MDRRHAHSPAAGATKVLVALAAFLVAGAAARADGFRPREREHVVRTAYETLARYMADSGTAVAFEIGSFRTIPAAGFGRVAWLDAVTMPGGDMVDVARRSVDDGRTGATTVSYEPTWRLAAAEYLLTDEGRRLTGMTVADVLGRIAAQQPDAGRAEALSTYRITVMLEGRSRTYRAAALWIPVGKAGRSRVFFMDHVTQGVEEVLHEKPVPARAGDRSLSRLGAATETCQQTSSFTSQSRSAEGTNGHFSGRHYANATAEFACHCSSDCVSTCQSNFVATACEDEGTYYDACHSMASSSRTSIYQVMDGLSQGAACAAGFGCVQKSCLFCSCGLGIEVGITGLTVTFTPSGSPDWADGNFDFGVTCAPCRAALGGGGGGGSRPGDPNYDDPGGWPGGGGGGGGGSCTTYCYGYQDGANYYLTCYPVCP